MFTNQASPTFCGWSLYSLLFGSHCVWFVTVDQDHCREASFSRLFVFWLSVELELHTHVIAWEYLVNE